MKYFKVEPSPETINSDGGGNLTHLNSIKRRFEQIACVQMYPNHHATLTEGDDGHSVPIETEQLSHNGFLVLIAVISMCHILATAILYYGITGQYKKGKKACFLSLKLISCV